jgi:hypothetical protein
VIRKQGEALPELTFSIAFPLAKELSDLLDLWVSHA